MKKGGVDWMSNNHVCLSCHQKNEPGHAFCEVCLPWCLSDKNKDLELLPKLEEMSLVEYLNESDYALLTVLPRPRNEIHWGELIFQVYDCIKDSKTYAEQFCEKTNDLLNHITQIRTLIDNHIKRIAKTESFALSYYSHFGDIEPTEIVGNSTVTVHLQDYELEFEVFRTKVGANLPTAMYTPPRQADCALIYSLQIATINGNDIRFDRAQIEACAELIDLHNKSSQNLESCIEVVKRRFADSGSIDFGFNFNYILPATHQLRTEISEIFNGNRGALAKDLLTCTMYKFASLDKTDCSQDPGRIRSFQFLKQIVFDLKDNVTPIQDGLLVESITGNCYQIERTRFKFAREEHIVFWSVHEIYNNEFICIEPTSKGPKLPDGDYLAALVLSLYDDHESSNLIHTLAS